MAFQQSGVCTGERGKRVGRQDASLGVLEWRRVDSIRRRIPLSVPARKPGPCAQSQGFFGLECASSGTIQPWRTGPARRWPTSPATANLSHEALYWIRIAHESGRYALISADREVRVRHDEQFRLPGSNGDVLPGHLRGRRRDVRSPGIDGVGQEFLDVMEQNPALFDGVAWHSYPDPPISTAMRAGQTYAPATSMLWSVDCLTDRAVELHQRFPGKKIALTEWNASSAATRPAPNPCRRTADRDRALPDRLLGMGFGDLPHGVLRTPTIRTTWL